MVPTTQDMLDAAKQAYVRCLDSQQYTVEGRAQRMADLADIEASITRLEAKLANEASGGRMASLIQLDRPT